MNDALVIEVVRKTVTVDCSVEEAFRIFTTDALSWWPVESHSIHQTVSEIVFEPRAGGEVYEVVELRRARPLGDRSRVGPAKPARAGVGGHAERHGHRGRGALPSRGRDDARRARAPRLGAHRRERRGEARELRLGVGARPRQVRRLRLDEGAKSREPAKPLVPRDGGVRRRGRGQHEELRRAEHPLLEPVLGSLAEDAPVRVFPDERDDARLQLERDRPRAAHGLPRSRRREGRSSRVSSVAQHS